jgi:hypothetical protein
MSLFHIALRRGVVASVGLAVALTFFASSARSDSVVLLPPPLPGDTAPLVLTPGQTGIAGLESSFFQGDRYSPLWTLVDQQTFQMTFKYPPFSPAQDHNVTFINSVYRNPDTGNLIFGYRFSGLPSFEDFDFDTKGFGGLRTEVTSNVGAGGFKASRSADGSVINFLGQGESSNISYIATDATSFNKNGITIATSSNQFGDVGAITDTIEVPGTFQPVAVPLPPAVWGGSVMLMAVMGLHKWQRRAKVTA